MLHGQKIWQTRAQEANWIFVLARTDNDAPKHKGLTFFLVPMEQPGVDVRPIRMIGGAADFNEVFLDGARTSTDNVVGEVNGGWAVANSVLGLERGDEAATNPVQFRAELDRLIDMARDIGRTGMLIDDGGAWDRDVTSNGVAGRDHLSSWLGREQEIPIVRRIEDMDFGERV